MDYLPLNQDAYIELGKVVNKAVDSLDLPPVIDSNFLIVACTGHLVQNAINAIRNVSEGNTNEALVNLAHGAVYSGLVYGLTRVTGDTIIGNLFQNVKNFAKSPIKSVQSPFKFEPIYDEFKIIDKPRALPQTFDHIIPSILQLPPYEEI